MRDIRNIFAEPEPFFRTHLPAPMKGRRPTGSESEARKVTMFRIGGSPIENPQHGASGWCEGKLLIYNNKWGQPGWYLVADYQKLKVVWTRKADWRIMPESFYASDGTPWLSPPPLRVRPEYGYPSSVRHWM